MKNLVLLTAISITFLKTSICYGDDYFRKNSFIEKKYFKNCININKLSSKKQYGQYICYPSSEKTPGEAQKIMGQQLEEGLSFTEFFGTLLASGITACELTFIEYLKKHPLMQGGSYSIAFTKHVQRPEIIANAHCCERKYFFWRAKEQRPCGRFRGWWAGVIVTF